MLALNQVSNVMLRTIYGAYEEQFQQRDFQIEQSDVGRGLPNYLGYNQKELIFKKAHVGRKIKIISQNNGYNYWYFLD